jgi:cobyrinic acid a,c-diamide synthase
VTALAKGLVIGAPRSGSGKTTITLGLLRALKRRGIAVAGAKCGPDYIDPAFHAAATGRPSLNLDGWAMPPGLVADLAHLTSKEADLVVCEALMGFFDGVPGPKGRNGSSADVAAATGWPLVLVLDVSGQSQTAAALAKGFATYDSRIRLAGVILNKVGSDRHKRLATSAIVDLGIPVLGSLPRSDAIRLPERHLGLVQAEETGELAAILDQMADLIETHVDIDGLIGLAQIGRAADADHAARVPPPGQRIAIARDAAFSFFYPHLMASWRAAGAELSFFSPLGDEAPDLTSDICWLPGGYPELHAGRLAGSARFKAGVRHFAETKPVHGECGGYMALGETLVDADGVSHEMLGLLSVRTSFAKRKMTLGYRQIELTGASALGEAGTRLRGHEFHYATIVTPGDDQPFALAGDAYGSEPVAVGSRRGPVSGSFFHLIARDI